MPLIQEDQWISAQASSFPLSDLDDCAIGVDATYYLSTLLDNTPAHEPLLSALGGLTSIDSHINQNLDQWQSNNIIPFFIFDGQTVAGQEDVSIKRGREANAKTDEAWNLYSQSSGEQAVSAFGANPGAFQVQSVYPLLQNILKQRRLHYLVAPYNASAQLAYFESIDSDQIAGVMGSQELLLYPINDCIIRSIDWESKQVSAISKKKVLRNLAVSESTFVDALLMCGTSFLVPFPPLQDPSLYQKSYSISEAVNLLRAFDKTVSNVCSNYSDMLQQDPTWLEKYRRARLAIQHYIYIAESGEVCVNDFDHLTQDNHEYLGLQLPEELFHYQNTGLIGSRILNCITHGQIVVQPTLDGTASPTYRKLVTEQIVPVKEQALGLMIPRVHRGIGHKEIVLRVWFDPKFSYKVNHRALQPPPAQSVGSWDVKDKDVREFFPEDFAGPVYLEVLALANPDFVAKTISAKDTPIRGIDSTDMVVSVTIWRFLHLRGYVNDSHTLTKWGNALATTLLALREALEIRENAPPLDEAALLAFELVKYGLLNGKFREGASPRKGSEDDKRSIVLISQCASLLKLRHKVYGYTGPLNKGLLAFRSLSSAVREADRDLIEAILASMFMYGQCKRERDDQLEISQRLPFSQEPDIGMGIATWTFFDEDDINDSKEKRATRLEEFPKTFVPFAEALADDMHICVDFVNAINQGLQTLSNDELPAEDKKAWEAAQAYLQARPF